MIKGMKKLFLLMLMFILCSCTRVVRTFECELVNGKTITFQADMLEDTSWWIATAHGSYWLRFSTWVKVDGHSTNYVSGVICVNKVY